MKFAIVDSRMSEKCRTALRNLNYSIVAVPPDLRYDTPIYAHPDVFICACSGKYLVRSSVFPIIKEQMFMHTDCASDKHFITVGEGTDAYPPTQIRYPNDCALNFAVCGKYMIGNFRYAAQAVLDFVNKYTLIPVSVRQGYAKCNICPVTDNALITEDSGIAAACRAAGLDVLLLETHAVALSGYPYGFIGGATATPVSLDGQRVLLFCGDITVHPEYERICRFCGTYGVQPIALSDEPLYDYGSIFLLEDN